MRLGTLLIVTAAALAALPAAAATARAPAYAASAAADVKPLNPAQRLERRFLQISAANMRFQAEGSRAALSRSSNPAVKDLANSLLARQQTAQAELLRLLHARGMAMPLSTNDHAKVLKQLAKLNGAKFDRVYVDEVVIRSYQADIANYERVAQQADDRVLRAWAERQLPTLRFHFGKAAKALPSAPLKAAERGRQKSGPAPGPQRVTGQAGFYRVV
jgi:putative membrane protein